MRQLGSCGLTRPSRHRVLGTPEHRQRDGGDDRAADQAGNAAEEQRGTDAGQDAERPFATDAGGPASVLGPAVARSCRQRRSRHARAAPDAVAQAAARPASGQPPSAHPASPVSASIHHRPANVRNNPPPRHASPTGVVEQERPRAPAGSAAHRQGQHRKGRDQLRGRAGRGELSGHESGGLLVRAQAGRDPLHRDGQARARPVRHLPPGGQESQVAAPRGSRRLAQRRGDVATQAERLGSRREGRAVGGDPPQGCAGWLPGRQLGGEVPTRLLDPSRLGRPLRAAAPDAATTARTPPALPAGAIRAPSRDPAPSAGSTPPPRGRPARLAGAGADRSPRRRGHHRDRPAGEPGRRGRGDQRQDGHRSSRAARASAPGPARPGPPWKVTAASIETRPSGPRCGTATSRSRRRPSRPRPRCTTTSTADAN